MLKDSDYEIYNLIDKEEKRRRNRIELIASENYASDAVLKVTGSKLTNKYAEGYPSKRYYAGCEFVDEIENIAIDRLKKLFKVNFVNVQPHSGSQANMAALFSILNTGDSILSMNLTHGGHLTHGYKVNFSGKLFNANFYGVKESNEMIDYDDILKIAKEVKPKLIIAGASAYSRKIDFSKFRDIADEVGAYFMADIAHISGLVATELHQSPIEYADIITSTTHKTLRGPRGGIILSNSEEMMDKANKNLFPGIQGGPLMNVIAAKAVCFKEALSDEFKKYQETVLENAKVLSKELNDKGFNIVSNGTDNHLFMINLKTRNISGREAEEVLYKAGITVNKNAVPYDQKSPTITSGIRIGTPAITTIGMLPNHMIKISEFIAKAINNSDSPEKLDQINIEVKEFMEQF